MNESARVVVGDSVFDGDVVNGKTYRRDTVSEALFRDCCATEWTRFNMTEPFICGDYVNATNGHIAVRMRASKCDWLANIKPPAPDNLVPPVDKLFWEKRTGEPIALSAPVPIETISCTVCGGSGKLGDCVECDGLGTCSCSCGDVHDCCECDGTGYGSGVEHDCDKCNGSGQVVNPKLVAVAVGSTFISNIYLNLLRKHGISEARIVDWNIESETVRPIRFSMGDVEGLLMPQRPAGAA